MSEPIRVLHFADVHIGVENYGKIDARSGLSARAQDYLQVIDEMTEQARARDVDLVVFAGDAFRSRNPDPTQQRAFALRVQALAQLAPTVLLGGNHDLPVNSAKASSMEIFHTLAVPNVWVALAYELRCISTKRGDVIVGAAPYPVRARLLDALPRGRQTVAEQADQLTRALDELLADLAQRAESLAESAADAATPRLLLGHFSVAGAVRGSEGQMILGRDIQVELAALAKPVWDYVALGHIHQHQNLTAEHSDAPPVVYSGSLERMDFSEAGQSKGFCWVELARGRTSWQFVESKARPMRALHIDCRDSDNPTRLALETLEQDRLADTILRLELRLRPENEALLDERALSAALKRAGVFHIAGIRKDLEQVSQTRLGSSPEGLSPLQLLERYFELRSLPAQRREALLDRARHIVDGRAAKRS